MNRFSASIACLVASMLAGARLTAAAYYVDARHGDDASDGRSPRYAWRSLPRVNQQHFSPGDRVRFRAGGVWSGQLRLEVQGLPERPIRFERYGQGRRPRIETRGEFEDAILLRNAQCLEVRDFEITNRGEGDAPRRGVHVVAANAGTLTNIVLANLFVHDVNGTQKRKDNGGIIFRTIGDRVASRFEGLRIEGNIVWRVDRSGIAADSYHASRSRWFPSLHVVIRDNWLGDIGGDGVVPWATEGALIEHNILRGANERAGTYNAGIWPWSTDNTVLRLNRASEVKTLMDGQGFDSDYNSRNTVLEYNLSHDNEGGFLLICTPGQRKATDNLGNLGTIVRYNISRNDRARIFHVSAAEATVVHHNAIYVGRGLDVQMILLSDWSGWARGLEFRDNLFHVEGIARYGHQVRRGNDGSYVIGPGWGPAQDVQTQGNVYLGDHRDGPKEPAANTRQAPRPVQLDWPGPQFDPGKDADRLAAFLKAHRAWMVRLMKRQFDRDPRHE